MGCVQTDKSNNVNIKKQEVQNPCYLCMHGAINDCNMVFCSYLEMPWSKQVDTPTVLV